MKQKYNFIPLPLKTPLWNEYGLCAITRSDLQGLKDCSLLRLINRYFIRKWTFDIILNWTANSDSTLLTGIRHKRKLQLNKSLIACERLIIFAISLWFFSFYYSLSSREIVNTRILWLRISSERSVSETQIERDVDLFLYFDERRVKTNHRKYRVRCLCLLISFLSVLYVWFTDESWKRFIYKYRQE